jgi:hypothetical protein
VQDGTSKISGCTISMQAAVHPRGGGALAAGTQFLKKTPILKLFFSDFYVILLSKSSPLTESPFSLRYSDVCIAASSSVLKKPSKKMCVCRVSVLAVR